uniref:Uncharacterized protein n=1 Tax=Angiostrongylus cantonensis TaxID=6313 RepID=A0A0K0DDN3_ANGCA
MRDRSSKHRFLIVRLPYSTSIQPILRKNLLM